LKAQEEVLVAPNLEGAGEHRVLLADLLQVGAGVQPIPAKLAGGGDEADERVSGQRALHGVGQQKDDDCWMK
jgi:hypothetical protein